MDESFAGEQGKRKWRGLFYKPLTPEEEAEEEQNEKESLARAHEYVSGRLGENPTPEQLLEMCVKLQSELWQSRKRERGWVGFAGKTLVTGDTINEQTSEELSEVNETLEAIRNPIIRKISAQLAQEIGVDPGYLSRRIDQMREEDKDKPRQSKRVWSPKGERLTLEEAERVKRSMENTARPRRRKLKAT